MVDEIGDVLEVEEECFEPTPETMASQMRDLVKGVYKLQDHLLLVLNSERAVESAVPVDALNN